MNVLNRKTVIITINTSSPTYINNTISQRIDNINFIPDEVILRTISVANLDNDNEVFIISSNLVNNNVMGVCCVHSSETTVSNPQSVFPLGRQINGNYTFTLLDSSGNITNLNNMIVSLCLEFVEYRKN